MSMSVHQWTDHGESIMNTPEKPVIKGKHIAITGSLLFYKRQEAFELISSRGGIPQENVTKETDYLVVGHYRKNTIIGGKSNKRILAERYIRQGCSIKIIKEDQFLPMLWYALAETTGK